jgi:hypothetical protein
LNWRLSLLAVSGAPLTILNYEGVSGVEKCSCLQDFFAFLTRPVFVEAREHPTAWLRTRRFSAAAICPYRSANAGDHPVPAGDHKFLPPLFVLEDR